MRNIDQRFSRETLLSIPFALIIRELAPSEFDISTFDNPGLGFQPM